MESHQLRTVFLTQQVERLQIHPGGRWLNDVNRKDTRASLRKHCTTETAAKAVVDYICGHISDFEHFPTEQDIAWVAKEMGAAQPKPLVVGCFACLARSPRVPGWIYREDDYGRCYGRPCACNRGPA